ncbi:unnamed protein product, partial [Rotaria magnacalcarata]
TTQLKPDISGEQKLNGHQNSSVDNQDNKSDESDDENAIIEPGNGQDKKSQTNGNHNGDTEQE